MKSEFKNVAGIKTHFVKHGTGKNKILCLHGWGGSVASWDNLISKLEKKIDTTIIAVDLPGFGTSEMPPISGWSISQYGKWLEELITKLKWKNPTLMGHSFGCRVIIKFLEKNTGFDGKIILHGAAGIKWPPGIRQRITTKIKPIILPFKKVVPTKIWNKVTGKIFGARDWAHCPIALKKTLEKTLQESCVQEKLHKIEMTYFSSGEKKMDIPLSNPQKYFKKN
jgi:pimeloyl-ACP methyl ester carboxylesterase